MQETITSPTLRVRIHHSHTLKDGWRCDETTVELTWPIDHPGYDQIRPLMQASLYAAHQDGLDETRRRAAQEGQRS